MDSTVIEEQWRLSYRHQCTGKSGMENMLQCEGDGGGCVVFGCWNITRDSSQLTPHTLAGSTD